MEKERVKKSILAAFNSVNLINELKTKNNLTEYESNRLIRNKKHLELMLKKDWFLNNLTDQEKSDIELAII